MAMIKAGQNYQNSGLIPPNNLKLITLCKKSFLLTPNMYTHNTHIRLNTLSLAYYLDALLWMWSLLSLWTKYCVHVSQLTHHEQHWQGMTICFGHHGTEYQYFPVVAMSLIQTHVHNGDSLF